MRKDELEFCESIVNHKAHVYQAQQKIKEEFGVESVFDENHNEIQLLESNDPLKKIAAKKYLQDNFGEDKILIA